MALVPLLEPLEGTAIKLRLVSAATVAVLASVVLPTVAAAAPVPATRVVANAFNTGIRTPLAELTLVEDTSIDSWQFFDGVRFPVGTPVVVGAQGAAFNDSYFPSGLVFNGTQSISRVEESTVVGGVTLSSTRGIYLSNVDISRATIGVNVVGNQGRPSYNTGLNTVWVHHPKTACGFPATGIRVQGAQGFVLDRSNIDMGGWKLGCGGTDLINAAFDADDGFDGNSQLGIFSSNLNGGSITFQRGGFADLEDGFTVEDTWIGPDFHYSPQGFPPPGPLVKSVGNVQVIQTNPPRFRVITIT